MIRLLSYKARLPGLALALLAGLIVALTPSAAAESRSETVSVTLKHEIAVTGHAITLGDLFHGLAGTDDRTGIVVAGAPDPGERTILSAAQVRDQAASHGVAWDNARRLRGISVRRLGTTISADTIEAAIAARIAEDGLTGDLDVILANRAMTLAVPVDAPKSVGVEGFSFDPETGYFQGTLRAPAGDPSAPGVPVSGRAYELVVVPVPARPIARDEVITARDLTEARVRLDRLPNDVTLAESELVGMSPRRSLRAGAAVRRADVTQPLQVRKGKRVTVTYTRPGMTLSMVGLALDDGAQGDIIRIRNTSSNLVREGRVEGPGRVGALSRLTVTAQN